MASGPGSGGGQDRRRADCVFFSFLFFGGNFLPMPRGQGVLAGVLVLHMVKLAAPREASEPWVDIISPTPAQLFIEGQFPAVELHFRVHGLQMGAGAGAANVYVIRHAMSYGGDAFRGREHQRATPDVRVYETEARIPLDSLQLDLGLHQVRVHLVEEDAASGREREVAESAAFFEIRLPLSLPGDEAAGEGAERSCRVSDELLSQAYEDKAWLAEEGEDAGVGQQQSVEETTDRMWREYVQLHARMLSPTTPAHERRLLILDQTAGGLGNRLGSVISGLLLAMLSQRALLVHWDLTDYLLNGDPASGGIRWQFTDLAHIRAKLGEEAVAGVEYIDIGELAPFLTCSRYTVSDDDAADADEAAGADGGCSSDLAAGNICVCAYVCVRVCIHIIHVCIIVSSNLLYRQYSFDTVVIAEVTFDTVCITQLINPHYRSNCETTNPDYSVSLVVFTTQSLSLSFITELINPLQEQL